MERHVNLLIVTRYISELLTSKLAFRTHGPDNTNTIGENCIKKKSEKLRSNVSGSPSHTIIQCVTAIPMTILNSSLYSLIVALLVASMSELFFYNALYEHPLVSPFGTHIVGVIHAVISKMITLRWKQAGDIIWSCMSPVKCGTEIDTISLRETEKYWLNIEELYRQLFEKNV